MKQLLASLLSFCLVFSSVSPALAQLVKAGEGVRAASEAITKGSKELTEASKTVSKMSNYALRLPSSIIDAPQGVSYLAKVQQFTFANLGEQFSTLSTAQKINFYQKQSEIFLPLSKEQVKELVADAQKRGMATITDAQKDYLYLSVFPEQVIKGSVSSELLSESLFYNRGILLQGVNGGAEEWGKQMAAITNLGLFGEAKDARLIVDTAKQITGPKEMLTDIVTFRALSNLEAYDKIQELANLRINTSGKLSYVWHDFSQYMAQNGYPLEIPSSEIYPVGPDGKLNETLEKALVKYNPYNLFNGHAGSELTAQFKTLRTQLQTELVKQEVINHISKDVKVNRMPTRPVQPVFQPKFQIQPEIPAAQVLSVQTPAASVSARPLQASVEIEKTGTAPVSASAKPCNNAYCSLFPFVPKPGTPGLRDRFPFLKRLFPKRNAAAKVAEEPGLHDNTVTPVYETRSVSQEDLGVVPEVEKVIVPVEENGFKFTIETDGEKILHNVNVIISSAFKTAGYNRLTLSNKGIFQLRDFNLKPENLNRFFIELDNSKGELWQLLRGKTGEELTRPLRIKLQRVKVRRQKLASIPVELEGAKGVPTVAQVDKKLLPKKANASLGKLIVQNNGKIYYSQYGKPPFLLQNYSVRLPKGDSKYWGAMMQSLPDVSFTLKVRPSENKMKLLAGWLPMNMLGMGKTISPELAERSAFDASTSSGIMFTINNITPVLIGLLRPMVDKYGEAAVLRLGSGFFLLGGASALATGLYGHLGTGMMTPLQLAGFLFSTASIAIGTNIVRFAQNLSIGANVGVVSDRKKQAASGPELPQEAYTWKHLAQRFKEVFTTRQTQPGGAIVWYQAAQMFKNLGTLAFLGLPWLVNTVARKAFGAELGLDFSMSYIPYTALAAWTAWKLSTTALKDTIPTQPAALERQFDETIARATEKLAQKWMEGVAPAEKDITGAVEDINTSLDLLVKAKQRQKIKFDEKEFVQEMKQKSVSALFDRLIQEGVAENQAIRAKATLQEAFASMDPHAVTLKETFAQGGMVAGAIAATLATVHELSVSNGFAFALRNLIPSGDAANALTALALYGSMSLGRLGGNWLSRRMSGSSLYTLASACSAIGTGMMIGAGENVPLLISGAVLASFGVGNFFSQMYDFMTKSADKKYRRVISLILNYTMPAAAILSIPMRKLVEVTGIPALDLSISGVALLASFAFSYRMFAKSSLVRTIQNESSRAAKKIKNLFHRNRTPKTPTDLNNAAPAQ